MSECVLGKTQKGTFTLSMVVASKWFHNDYCWLCLPSSKRWQSVSRHNLHKEHNRDFLRKKTIFIILDTTQIPVKNLFRTYWTSDR